MKQVQRKQICYRTVCTNHTLISYITRPMSLFCLFTHSDRRNRVPVTRNSGYKKKFQLRYPDNPSQKNKRTNKNRSGPTCYIIILSRLHVTLPRADIFRCSTKPHYSFSLCIRSIRSWMDPTSRFNSSLLLVLSFS